MTERKQPRPEPVRVATWSELPDREPRYALVGDVDLVVVRWGDNVSVLYGRCLHRGALMADGHIDGDNLICGVHGWDYRYDTGVSEYNNAEVRGIPEGTAAISPATFPDLHTIDDFRAVADEVRQATGGIPIGFKLSAQHIEADLDFALEASADYVILDGRGGGTGAAPLIFRDNISVPTIPALARARRHLDNASPDTSLVITGGLRTPADFAKAIALGADAVAVSNAAIQAIGCLGMRACHTNNCPVGIATQKPGLRRRLIVDESARRLARFFEAATEMMCLLARACGHDRLAGLETRDLTSWKREIADLAGVAYAGDSPD